MALNASGPICQSGVCFAPNSGPTSGSCERLLRARSRKFVGRQAKDRTAPIAAVPRQCGGSRKRTYD
jgi:hypothetical protein